MLVCVKSTILKAAELSIAIPKTSYFHAVFSLKERAPSKKKKKKKRERRSKNLKIKNPTVNPLLFY